LAIGVIDKAIDGLQAVIHPGAVGCGGIPEGFAGELTAKIIAVVFSLYCIK
jgi:hypothetical protein